MEYSIVVEVSNRKEAQELYKLFTTAYTQQGQTTSTTRSLVSVSELVKDQGYETAIPRLSVLEMRVKDDKVVAQWMGHGTIRLFKCSQAEDGANAEVDLLRVPGDNTMCSILFTPTYLNCEELLHWFLGPVILDQVSHFRLVKLHDRKGEYMVLMKFRQPADAKRFQTEFNGKKFNSLDPETCHVVFVKEIIFNEKLFPDPNKDFPYLLRDPFTNGSGMVELPTCPVCLERLDSDTTGLITTACQHTFHCHCMDQWKGGRCPVCRYSNKENINNAGGASCNVCGSSENLWVCLICGHMGCGRYNSKHAISHYETTSHCFAMDITTNRVWDYAGDNYVHRLVQNEVDGKLVEVGGSTTKRNQEYHLEYVQVLISQLESQREYYEGKLESINEQYTATKLDELSNCFQKFKLSSEQSSKKLEARIEALNKQLDEERLMNLGLRENLKHIEKERDALLLRQEVHAAEKEELEATISDLMFHVQTNEKLSKDPDAAEATLVIRQPEETIKKKPAKKKKKPPHRFGK